MERCLVDGCWEDALVEKDVCGRCLAEFEGVTIAQGWARAAAAIRDEQYEGACDAQEASRTTDRD